MKHVIASMLAFVASIPTPVHASEWVVGPPLTTARAGSAVVMDQFGRIIVTGGRIQWWSNGALGTATDTLEILDTTLPEPQWQWASSLPPMNTRREFHCMICVNGFAYVLGGSNSLSSGTVYFSSVERLDLLNPASGWQSVADMPTPRNIAGAAVDALGRIYIIGGSNGVDISLKTVERYDPARNVWETLPDLNIARGRPGVTCDRWGRIYVVGGGINQGNVSSVERYDPAHPELNWEALPPIPAAMQPAQSASVTTGADGRIYLAGGATAGGSLLDRCIRFDPDANQWQNWTPLPAARYTDAQCFVTDRLGRMWLIGTYDSTAPSNIVYWLQGPCGAHLVKPSLLDSNGDHSLNVADLLEIIARWGNCLP